MNATRKNSGFTMVEMLVAVAILAMLLASQKRHLQEARELAKAAQWLDAGDGTAEALAAWILILMGEETEGLIELEQAARAHPFNQTIWFRFARALQDAGHEEEARRALSIAIRVGPKPQRPPPPASCRSASQYTTRASSSVSTPTTPTTESTKASTPRLSLRESTVPSGSCSTTSPKKSPTTLSLSCTSVTSLLWVLYSKPTQLCC